MLTKADRRQRSGGPVASPTGEFGDGRLLSMRDDQDTPAETQGWARVTTGSGLSLWLREVTTGDRPLLVEGFGALSPQSRQYRFFTGVNRLSETMIDRLLDVGIRSHIALVAFESPDPRTAQAVGAVQFVASRYSRSGIEFALTVADQFHRRGIGSALVSSIAVVANELGHDSMSAEVLTTNSGVQSMLRRFGAELRRDPEDATVLHVELDTEAASASLQAGERAAIVALFDRFQPTISNKPMGS